MAATSSKTQETKAKSGGSIGQLMVPMLMITLLACAFGAAFAFHMGAAAEAAAKADAESPQNPTQSDAGAKSNLVDLPPIVTNLSAPQDTWVRLEASIIIDPKTTQNPDALAAQIADDLLAYLRTTTLSQIEGAAGLQNLRQDLNERVAIRTGGKAKELILRTLVVQ
jgi:flagellar FliL protein